MNRKCNIQGKKVWYEWSVIVKIPKQMTATTKSSSTPIITTHPNAKNDNNDDNDDNYEVIHISPIHNPNGRSYHVAM
jgi:hypothetical protein